MLALPIFTASHPATIVGADELNFCVRDGNRWTLIAINTNCGIILALLFFPVKGYPFPFSQIYAKAPPRFSGRSARIICPDEP